MKKQVKQEILHETNMLLGKKTKITYDTRRTKLGCMNVMVLGGTGEGKSRNFLKPNIWSLPTDPNTKKPHSFVFTDPKGELAEDTAGFLQKHGYKIKLFNLNEMKYSDCYNPFKYFKTDLDVMIMVDSLVKSGNGDGGGKDPYWDNMAKAMLNSICLYLFHERKYKDQTFAEVSRLLNSCGRMEDKPSDYEKNVIDKLIKESSLGKAHPAVEWFAKVSSAKGSTYSSILSSAQGAMRIFASLDVQRLTSTDTMELDMLGDEPIALYICTSVTNSTFDFLASLMYTQLFETLMTRANTVYAKQGHSLPHHVTFWMDEFANILQIPDFDKKIATFRQANLSTVIILQSPSQLDSLYDKKADDIKGNNFITIFLGSAAYGDNSAPEFMSKALGKMTIVGEDTSENKVGNGKDSLLLTSKSYSHSYRTQERALMLPDEIRTLPGDECLILISKRYPIRDKKMQPENALNYWEAKDCRYDIHENKKTFESYRLGVESSYLVDEERKGRILERQKEDEMYEAIVSSMEEDYEGVEEAAYLNLKCFFDVTDEGQIVKKVGKIDVKETRMFSPTHEWDIPDDEDIQQPEPIDVEYGWGELSDSKEV